MTSTDKEPVHTKSVLALFVHIGYILSQITHMGVLFMEEQKEIIIRLIEECHNEKMLKYLQTLLIAYFRRV